MRGAGGSLYARIVVRISWVLLATGALLIGGAWVYARFAAEQAFDRVLLSAALQIAENTWIRNGVINVDPPLSAFSVLSQGDRVFYQVIGPGGRVVAGDRDLQVPVPGLRLRTGPVLRDAVHHGEPVRVAFVGREMFDPRSRGWATIVLAVTEDSRNDLAEDLTLKALGIVAIMGVVTLGGTMFAARSALEPMWDLAGSIRGRDPNSSAPLASSAPAEAAPLVDALNDYIGRLDARIALMRRVIGDVAHQIRTPITAAIAQVELLDVESGGAERRRQLARVRDRLAALAALVNQLVSHVMVLHRAERGAREPVDLCALVRKEMTSLLSSGLPRDVDVALDAPDDAIVVPGDPVMLREALRNLLTNALRHGSRSRLQVRIDRRETDVRIVVSDDGPGIPAERQQQVRQPFTPRSDDGGGTSLGLAIVEEVMTAHGGAMVFRTEPNGDFAVELILPT